MKDKPATPREPASPPRKGSPPRKAASTPLRRPRGPHRVSTTAPASGLDALAASARRSVDASVESGARLYERARMLPRLIPVGPDEIGDESPAGRRHILRMLARALRGERRRGRAGHWTYSLDRHIGLMQAFRAERARR